jgi:hypothetical protein
MSCLSISNIIISEYLIDKIIVVPRCETISAYSRFYHNISCAFSRVDISRVDISRVDISRVDIS